MYIYSYIIAACRYSSTTFDFHFLCVTIIITGLAPLSCTVYTCYNVLISLIDYVYMYTPFHNVTHSIVMVILCYIKVFFVF